jgi:phosphoribosyl-AMP cyclohydrolase
MPAFPAIKTIDSATIDSIVHALAFNADGLVAAIAQQHDTGEVLMLAWMNEEAVRRTLSDGIVHYYSRSRRALWKKGETSGHVQRLHDFRYDCDADAVLLQVDQQDVACHTGRRSCFFNQVTQKGVRVSDDPAGPYPPER